jgi:hypothetical protein
MLSCTPLLYSGVYMVMRSTDAALVLVQCISVECVAPTDSLQPSHFFDFDSTLCICTTAYTVVQWTYANL